MPEHSLTEIDETIGYMEKRLETGQGGRHSAMCRLSLAMAQSLRAHLSEALEEIKCLQRDLGRQP